MPRRTQESLEESGRAEGAQESPGEPKRAQESPGSPGEPRRAQESNGEPRIAQESHRRAQKDTTEEKLQRRMKLDEAYQAVFLKQRSGFNEIQGGHFNASMIRLGHPSHF